MCTLSAAHLLTYSLTHTRTHSSTHLLIHSFIAYLTTYSSSDFQTLSMSDRRGWYLVFGTLFDCTDGTKWSTRHGLQCMI